MAGGAHGGAETAFVDMCIALHETGHVVDVVTRPNPLRVPRLQAAGIKVHTLPFGGHLDIYTPWAMRTIIKNFRPDVVQTWMARGTWKTPRWHPHMGIPHYPVTARLGGYYNLKYFKSADYFTTITPDIRQYLINNGIPGDHVHHINNFAETESTFTSLNRQDYNVPEDATLLIALGRLHKAKAFDTLINAVAPLTDTYLWIAGEGPDRDDLETLIGDLNLQNRVQLLGWREDRAALFDASDICVFPSRYEPFGTVFVQAWANKTPVICTKSDGPRQFVHDRQDGLLVDIDDTDGLTRAIQDLANNKNLQNSLIENGYDRYQQEFSKDKTVAAYLAWYEHIRGKD